MIVSFKKLVTSLAITLLLFSSFGAAYGASASTSASGTVISDIAGHWAEAQLSTWIGKGWIKGYDDGQFKPDNEITRVEFVALINRSFGFTEEAAISFRDVQDGSWAYPEIARAVQAGYLTGYADGTIGADKPITRQEAAAMVDRLLKLDHTESQGTAFTDSAVISPWAKDAVDAVVAKGIMSGYAADHSFKPVKPITRAEAVVTLDRAMDARAVVYDKAGTYGPATGVQTINKNVAVQVAGVILQNMVINGDLLLAEGIGDGENSIHFNNSVLVDIVIDKKSGSGIVRIVSEGSTTVALVIVNSPANIQESGSTGAGFGNVNISEALPTGSKVTLTGSFDTVNVSAQQIVVDVPEGTIEQVNANATATGTSLNLSQGATINTLLLDAVLKVLGEGAIVAAKVNIPGTTFQTPPQSDTSTSSTTTPTAPNEPDSSTPPSDVHVSEISVTGEGGASTVVIGGCNRQASCMDGRPGNWSGND